MCQYCDIRCEIGMGTYLLPGDTSDDNQFRHTGVVFEFIKKDKL